ncbi:MAG: response regulator [Candidatus Nanopelagicales bacterium]
MPDTSITAVIAEDESLIRMDLTEILTELGYEVVGTARDGEEAVQLVGELKPDIVLLDVKMPKLDGVSAAEIISGFGTTAIVMVTAFSQPDLVERATAAGIMAFLVKPVSASDIGPAVSVAFNRFMELKTLEQEVGNVTTKLDERKLVDRAKGVIQAKYGLDESGAFRWLQKTAMDKRMSLADVAQRVIDLS